MCFTNGERPAVSSSGAAGARRRSRSWRMVLRWDAAHGRNRLAEQFRGKRCGCFPGAARRQDVVADVVEEPNRNGLDSVVQEWIFNVIIIVEVANRFDHQLLQIEARRKCNLRAQGFGMVARLRLDLVCRRVPPLGDCSPLAKPHVIALRVVTIESRQGSDDTDPARRFRTAAVEVVFRKVTHKAGAAEDERQSVDDRALARAVGTHQHIVLAEAQARPPERRGSRVSRERVASSGVSLRRKSPAFQNLDQLCDYLELAFVRAGEHDRLEVRVDGIEGDLHVAP